MSAPGRPAPAAPALRAAPFLQWRPPDSRRRYLLSFDSAEGVAGGDYSVADVWDIAAWEQVAQWRGHLAPDRFGALCYGLGSMYGWAWVWGEISPPGNVVMAALRAASYPNLWSDAQVNRPGEPGWRTTEKSKATLISEARAAVRELDIRLNSAYSIGELKTFVRHENGELAAQPGCHDDCVISLAGAVYALKRIALSGDGEEGLPARQDLRARQGRPGGRRLGGARETGIV